MWLAWPGLAPASRPYSLYESLANILERMGVSVSPTAIRVKNTAAVMVTATLPAFAQPGMLIDRTVSSIGDAANLQGGTLVLTSLRGSDSQVYAVAQGPVVTGGFAAGRAGAQQAVNHPTVGRLPNGATVERPAPSVPPKSAVRLQLRQSDFTTSARIVEAVNRKYASAGLLAAKGREWESRHRGYSTRLRVPGNEVCGGDRESLS